MENNNILSLNLNKKVISCELNKKLCCYHSELLRSPTGS